MNNYYQYSRQHGGSCTKGGQSYLSDKTYPLYCLLL